MSKEVIIHPDQNSGDDLSDLTLMQARMITALDDDPKVPPGPPRAVVVVDDTMSMGEYFPERKVTLEAARKSLRAMFAAAAGLRVQVVPFRGQPSEWFTDPEEAAQWIAGIKHAPGWTQHGKAFAHIIREATKQPIHAAVVFTDAVELRGPGNPDGDVMEDLCKDAMRMKRLGCTTHLRIQGHHQRWLPNRPRRPARRAEDQGDRRGWQRRRLLLYNPADPKPF